MTGKLLWIPKLAAPKTKRLFRGWFRRHGGGGRGLGNYWGVGYYGGDGISAGQFVGEDCDGDAAVLGAAFRGRVVSDGAVLAVSYGSDAARVNACCFDEEMDGGEGAALKPAWAKVSISMSSKGTNSESSRGVWRL